MKTACALSPSLFLFAIALLPAKAFGFAELVRHNYVNCTSCHVSPTGGGVLTAYGRELSRELLSTAGRDNPKESQFAYGLLEPPEWLAAMVMYRSVVTHQKSPVRSKTEYIYMQGDLELAATIQPELIIDATLGLEGGRNAETAYDLISRRHFVNYRPTDTLSFRFGRFFPQFGIYTPDHVIPTRRGLGWDQGQETYNLEAAYIGDVLNVFGTAVFGRFDKPSLDRETGVALSPSIALADHHKIGLSYFHGSSDRATRHVGGPFAILGFTPRFFLLSEFDFQSRSLQGRSGAPAETGYVNYQRLDYEVQQGLHLYFTQDLQNLVSSRPRTLVNSFGLGAQFFPRPHLEINASWQKLRNLAIANEYGDFAWLMFNLYL